MSLANGVERLGVQKSVALSGILQKVRLTPYFHRKTFPCSSRISMTWLYSNRCSLRNFQKTLQPPSSRGLLHFLGPMSIVLRSNIHVLHLRSASLRDSTPSKDRSFINTKRFNTCDPLLGVQSVFLNPTFLEQYCWRNFQSWMNACLEPKS